MNNSPKATHKRHLQNSGADEDQDEEIEELHESIASEDEDQVYEKVNQQEIWLTFVEAQESHCTSPNPCQTLEEVIPYGASIACSYWCCRSK